MHIRLFVILLCFQWAGAAAPDFTRYAFTLEVRSGEETFRTGTGCLVKAGATTYYVTAHHLFDDLPDEERAARLKTFTVVSETNHQLRFAPAEFVPVAHVQNLGRLDLMVFKMKPNLIMSGYEVTVAPSAPIQDETVYLAARLPGRAPATYGLKVLFADEDHVAYEKISNVEKYTGASGGPIFNAKGQLVGTYTGRSLIEPNKPAIRCLFGTPRSSFDLIFPVSPEKK